MSNKVRAFRLLVLVMEAITEIQYLLACILSVQYIQQCTPRRRQFGPDGMIKKKWMVALGVV